MTGIMHAICPRCGQPHTPWCPVRAATRRSQIGAAFWRLRAIVLRTRQRDARDRLAVLAGLEDGSMHWSERFDYADLPPATDAQEAAIDLARAALAGAR